MTVVEFPGNRDDRNGAGAAAGPAAGEGAQPGVVVATIERPELAVAIAPVTVAEVAAPVPAAAAPARPVGAVPVPAAQTSLAKAQQALTMGLAEAAWQVRRLGVMTVAGIATAVLAVVIFIGNNLPQGKLVAGLKAQLAHLAPSATGTVTALPGGGMVLAALPPRDSAPAIVAKVLEEARASGIDLPKGQYEYVPAREGVAAKYRMTFPVRAEYPAIREFMDRTLVALPAVAVEGLRIERKNVGDNTVEAELRLSAYVREQ
jgi:hypothetical protein